MFEQAPVSQERVRSSKKGGLYDEMRPKCRVHTNVFCYGIFSGPAALQIELMLPVLCLFNLLRGELKQDGLYVLLFVFEATWDEFDLCTSKRRFLHTGFRKKKSRILENRNFLTSLPTR